MNSQNNVTLSEIYDYISNLNYIQDVTKLNDISSCIYELIRINNAIEWNNKFMDNENYIMHNFFNYQNFNTHILEHIISRKYNDILKLIDNINDIEEFKLKMNGKYFGIGYKDNLTIDLFDIAFINYVISLDIAEKELLCSYSIIEPEIHIKHFLFESKRIKINYYVVQNSIVIYLNDYNYKTIFDITDILRSFKLLKIKQLWYNKQ